jgi:hypothetical protein
VLYAKKTSEGLRKGSEHCAALDPEVGRYGTCARILWLYRMLGVPSPMSVLSVPVNHSGCLVCPLSDLSPSSFITLGATLPEFFGTRHIQTLDCDIQNRGLCM